MGCECASSGRALHGSVANGRSQEPELGSGGFVAFMHIIANIIRKKTEL